jgi:hypothetical protein
MTISGVSLPGITQSNRVPRGAPAVEPLLFFFQDSQSEKVINAE